MQTEGTLQQLVEALTEELRRSSPAVRKDFKDGWWAAVLLKESQTPSAGHYSLRLQAEGPRRFLHSLGIDPD